MRGFRVTQRLAPTYDIQSTSPHRSSRLTARSIAVCSKHAISAKNPFPHTQFNYHLLRLHSIASNLPAALVNANSILRFQQRQQALNHTN